MRFFRRRTTEVVLVAPALQLDPFALPVLLDEHFVDDVLTPSILHRLKGVEMPVTIPVWNLSFELFYHAVERPVWVTLIDDDNLDFDFLAQLERNIKRAGGASPAVAQVYNQVVRRMNVRYRRILVLQQLRQHCWKDGGWSDSDWKASRPSNDLYDSFVRLAP
ncbi:hypothetical protein JCM8547_001947 [Rhodosporidiobolus lusitaniae]